MWARTLMRGPQAFRPDLDRTQSQALTCQRCTHPLECVDQHRRAGGWLGALLCPNCRTEYLYAYRWDRLVMR